MGVTSQPGTAAQRTLRARVRDLGDRRVVSSLLFGAASLLLTFGTSYLGLLIASESSGLAITDPEDLFGNAIIAIGALLIAAFGAIAGFVVGVTFLPATLVWILGWSRPLGTALVIVALELVTIPIIVLLAYWLSESSVSDVIVPAAFLVLGGAVPAAARYLTTSDGGRQHQVGSSR